MNQPDLFSWRPPRRKPVSIIGAHEWKIVSVRETAPDALPHCEIPQQAGDCAQQVLERLDVDAAVAVALMRVPGREGGHRGRGGREQHGGAKHRGQATKA